MILNKKGKLKKPKTPTKTTLRRKCDKLVSATCREEGRCNICGKTQNLQWCHFITRRIIRLRYEPENYACLCAGCHFRGHQHPGWFTEEWNKLKGPGTTEWLERESNRVEPVNEFFYHKILQD
jgi:hypothetical protein